MNLAFFLTPKADVIHITSHSTLRQAMEKMEIYRFAAVPILDDEGRYVGTLTEGDILWAIKRSMRERWIEAAEETRVSDVERRTNNRAMPIGAEIEDVIRLTVDQNFVPVVDDRGVFVGIVRRSSIIEYCMRNLVTIAG